MNSGLYLLYNFFLNKKNVLLPGATAVLLGRPVFFSLAVGGQEGVRRMLTIVRDELEAAMALCGCQASKRNAGACLVLFCLYDYVL